MFCGIKKVFYLCTLKYLIAARLVKICCDQQTPAVGTLKKKVFMYAIVEIAGQQFKVEAGNEIFVQRLPEANGAAVEFDKVLLVENAGKVKVGAPYVKGAKVTATVVDDSARADKILVFKKIRRKGFQKCNGHRQLLTKIKINEIA